MIPLEALFSAESDSIYSNDAFKAEMFYTQSWFLVHFFMLGDNSAHIGKLDNFIALIQQGLSNMDAARQAFGDLEKLQQDLDRYVKLSTLAYKWTQLQFDLKEKEYTAHTLSLADSLALRGTLLAEINRLDEAQDMLEQALELDSRNMTANEGMGMLCLQRKEYEKAGEYFTLAEELNSQSFLVQFHAAQSIFNQGSGDLEKAEACLRKALSINPDFVPAYYLLSHVALRQKEKLSVALVLARKAAELAPAEFHYRVHIGQVLLAMNNIEEAHSHALNLIAMAHTEPVSGF